MNIVWSLKFVLSSVKKLKFITIEKGIYKCRIFSEHKFKFWVNSLNWPIFYFGKSLNTTPHNYLMKVNKMIHKKGKLFSLINHCVPSFINCIISTKSQSISLTIFELKLYLTLVECNWFQKTFGLFSIVEQV